MAACQPGDGVGYEDIWRRITDASSLSAGDKQPSVVLGYWDARTIAQPLRYLLTFVLGVDGWEDKRYVVGPPPAYDKTSWRKDKENSELKLEAPNLPYLLVCDEGNHNVVYGLTQTRAIAKHISRMHDAFCQGGNENDLHLAGKCESEKARADMICDAIFDMWDGMFRVTYCDAPWPDIYPNFDPQAHVDGEDSAKDTNGRFKALLKEYEANDLPSFVEQIHKCLLRNRNGGDGWIAGTGFTYADLFVYEFLEQNRLLVPSCLDQAPRLQEYCKAVEALPQMSAYLQSPRWRPRPIQNRHSHLWKITPSE